jgi:hypothetical protein
MRRMPDPTRRPAQQVPPTAVASAARAGRFIATVFGLAFLGIGLSVIGFLWFGNDGFHEPPLFFKLFGSLIASVFVAIGGAAAYSAIFGGGLLAQRTDHTTPKQSDGSPATETLPQTSIGAYTCPSCGAGLARDADVSPMGDVKCPFCGRWFNVHGKQ